MRIKFCLVGKFNEIVIIVDCCFKIIWLGFEIWIENGFLVKEFIKLLDFWSFDGEVMEERERRLRVWVVIFDCFCVILFV